jgi:hypothetical protein
MTPTGRRSRSEPEMQQLRTRLRPVRQLPDLDFSKVEARVLASMTPEDIAVAKAERHVQMFRENRPEIVETWRRFAAVAAQRALRRKGRK